MINLELLTSVMPNLRRPLTYEELAAKQAEIDGIVATLKKLGPEGIAVAVVVLKLKSLLEEMNSLMRRSERQLRLMGLNPQVEGGHA